MDHKNEDRLHQIKSLMDDVQRTILVAAFKGRVCSENAERIKRMLKSALETAGRFTPED